MTRILILGGTGFVGRHVCEKLARLQSHVTVATRRTATARDLITLPLLQPVECDVHDEAALTRLVAGHDAVVNLVAILHGTEAAFQRAHVELPQKLARACTASRCAPRGACERPGRRTRCRFCCTSAVRPRASRPCRPLHCS
jgi:uncharacterized protein YbjT (DUF2867 family)